MAYDLALIARRQGMRRRVVSIRPIRPPVGAELAYLRILREMLRALRAFVRETIDPTLTAERGRAQVKTLGDAFAGMLHALRGFARGLERAALGSVRKLIGREAERHTAQWAASVQAAMSVDLAAVIVASDLGDTIEAAALRNAGRITALSDDAQRRIAAATQEAMTQGLTARTFAARLKREFGFLDGRARTIARDQIGKLTGDLTRLRHEEAGLDRYRWSTSKDERVRASHRANEGRFFAWALPPAVTGHPGHDVNCRCVPIAVVTFD